MYFDQILKLLCIIVVILPPGLYIAQIVGKYTGSNTRRRRMLEFKGTNKASQYRFGDDVNTSLSRFFSPAFVGKMKKAGIQTITDFLTYVVLFLILASVGFVLNLLFLPDKWYLVFVYGPILISFPFFAVPVQIASNEKDLVRQMPRVASIITREFSRTKSMDKAFHRVAEETTGWTQKVFIQMDEYLQAVKGDVIGSLRIMENLFDHNIVDQFSLSIKQGLNTDKIQIALGNVAKNALLERKKHDLAESKKNDGVIYTNAVILFLLMFIQIAYFFLTSYSFLDFGMI